MIIPARKSHFVNLFLALWIIVWLYGEFVIIGQTLQQGNQSADVFLFLWLSGWTLGGLFAVTMWLRNNEVLPVTEIHRIN